MLCVETAHSQAGPSSDDKSDRLKLSVRVDLTGSNRSTVCSFDKVVSRERLIRIEIDSEKALLNRRRDGGRSESPCLI
jgi:hypothetical protein